MSRNETRIDATPDQVFDVLLDAHSYADWVVGCKEIRDVDPTWPAVGSRFHHSLGAGPLTLDDSSEIMILDRPRHLRLEVRGRPLGVGVVDFYAEPDGSGTCLAMEEQATDGPALVTETPVQHLLLGFRNTETLRRLGQLVEERAGRSAA